MILSSIAGRLHLHQFLETLGTHALLEYEKNFFSQRIYFLYHRFWYDVWKLRNGKRRKRDFYTMNFALFSSIE